MLRESSTVKVWTNGPINPEALDAKHTIAEWDPGVVRYFARWQAIHNEPMANAVAQGIAAHMLKEVVPLVKAELMRKDDDETEA